MKKKAAKPKNEPRSALHVWCKEEEKETFRLAAEKEGFSNLSAWVLWNLRRSAKQTLSEEREK